VQEFVDSEDVHQLYSSGTYEWFRGEIYNLSKEVDLLTYGVAQEGKTISCYGCPAKFTLFSKMFNLDDKKIKYVVDDSPLKQGKFSPGKKIPIVSRDYFYKNPTDYCIISAWNMADSIIKKNPDYKGKFIVPMPKLRIV
jgi:hypothetical protein